MYGKVWVGHLSRPAARCNAVLRCRPAFCNAVPSSSNVGQLLSKSGLWCHADFSIVRAMGIVAKRWALFSKHLTSVISQPHIQAWLCNYRLSVTSTKHNKHTIQHNEQIHAGNQSIIILKVTNYIGCPISMQTHRVSSDPPRTDVMN